MMNVVPQTTETVTALIDCAAVNSLSILGIVGGYGILYHI